MTMGEYTPLLIFVPLILLLVYLWKGEKLNTYLEMKWDNLMIYLGF